MKMMRSVIKSLALVGGLFLFALAVDQIKLLKQLDTYLETHPQPYTSIAIVFLATGGVLWVIAILVALISQSRPMSEEQAKEWISPRVRPGWQVGLFRGKALGREARMEASFHEIKAAFQNGAWLRDPGWWPLCIGGIGVMLLCLGGFGYFFIIGPPTVKVMVGAAMAYAVARLTWGFAIA
jgi:hypothetical protein